MEEKPLRLCQNCGIDLPGRTKRDKCHKCRVALGELKEVKSKTPKYLEIRKPAERVKSPKRCGCGCNVAVKVGNWLLCDNCRTKV